MLFIQRKMATALVLFAALLISACASDDEVKSDSLTALDMINSRMEAAAAAQQELAMVVASAAKMPRRERSDIFTDYVTIDYVGDIEVALRRISEQYNYEFIVRGKRPPEGLMANIIVVKPRAVIDIVKAIAYQYPTRVDVKLTDTRLELIYKG